jgi:hypothetical protein
MRKKQTIKIGVNQNLIFNKIKKFDLPLELVSDRQYKNMYKFQINQFPHWTDEVGICFH